jgi:hypothetical protein
MNRTILLPLVLIAGWCGPVEAVDVSFEEARAAYLQNMQTLGVVNCMMQQETILTDEYFDVLQQRIGRYEHAVSTFPAGSEREDLERELARLKELLTGKEVYPVRKSAAIVIGSRVIQIAVPSSGPVPKVPVETHADLTEQCLHSVVLCWSVDQEPNAWMWQGKGGRDDGLLYGTISSKRPQDILGFPVPPVGAPDRLAFEQGRLSPFDAFFEDSYTDTRVVGSDQADGQPVLIVERSNESANVMRAVRASLSLDRNFIPIRIEWKACPPGMAFDDADPHEVLQVASFHEAPDGAFYPRSWTIERIAADDRSAAARNREKPVSIPYTSSIENWSVEEFQSNQQEPPLFSAIGFPEGTYCLNEDKQAYFTVGKAEEVVDTVLDAHQPATGGAQAAAPVAAAPTDDRSWLFWVNLAAIVGIIALFAARRMLRRPEG